MPSHWASSADSEIGSTLTPSSAIIHFPALPGPRLRSSIDSRKSDLILNKRSFETVLTVDDGEILAIGGLLNDDERKTIERIPLLSDIPLVGELFKSRSRSRSKTNLMVFIRPTVLRNREDNAALTARRYGYIRDFQLQRNPGEEPAIDTLVRDYMGTVPAGSERSDPGRRHRRFRQPAGTARSGRQRLDHRRAALDLAGACASRRRLSVSDTEPAALRLEAPVDIPYGFARSHGVVIAQEGAERWLGKRCRGRLVSTVVEVAPLLRSRSASRPRTRPGLTGCCPTIMRSMRRRRRWRGRWAAAISNSASRAPRICSTAPMTPRRSG